MSQIHFLVVHHNMLPEDGLAHVARAFKWQITMHANENTLQGRPDSIHGVDIAIIVVRHQEGFPQEDLDLVRWVRQHAPHLPILVLSYHPKELHHHIGDVTEHMAHFETDVSSSPWYILDLAAKLVVRSRG